MKRFSLLLSLVLSLSLLMAMPVLAAESNANEVDYSNYDFPDDAIVLYQSENGVIYQSNHLEEQIVEPRSNYNGQWIDAGEYLTGNFHIENPHTIINRTNGTFKVESEYSEASAQFILHDGLFTLANKTIKASNGDVRFDFKSNSKDLVVTYFVTKTSPKYGMRLNCWLW